jgi:peptidoglycan/LPS O-acetylase OafA/YrhL
LSDRRGTRLDSLTSLRAFAALAVFGWHVRTQIGDAGPVDPLLRAGQDGVAFFFILSGFVLAWSRRPSDGPRAFFARRFARIYPAFLVMWIVAAGLDVTGSGLHPEAFVAGLVLVQAWIPVQHVFIGVNSVSWSLSCEAFFYACFPALILGIVRLPARWRWWLIGSLVFLLLLIDAATLIAGPSREFSTGSGFWFWTVYIFPATRLIEFAAGVTLAVQMRDGWHPPLRTGGALLLALAGLTVSGLTHQAVAVGVIVLVPFLLLLAACASGEGAARASPAVALLRTRGLVAAGESSYCFYLVHQQVIRLSQRGPFPSLHLSGIALVALELVAASLAAYLLHRAVERPCERWLRHRLAVGRPSVVEAARSAVSASARP